jgi:hypothetical protein
MGFGDMLQAQIDAEDAAQYRWLLDHCQTTAHLWKLLARGDKGTVKDFKTMVGRCMESEKAAYERGRESACTSKGVE